MMLPIEKIRRGLKLLGRKVYIDLVLDLVTDDSLDQFDAVPRDLPSDTRRGFLMDILARPRAAGNRQSMGILIAINARKIEATDYLRRDREDLTREFAGITFDNHRGVTPLMLYLYLLVSAPDHPDREFFRKQYLYMDLRDLGPADPPRRGRISVQHEH